MHYKSNKYKLSVNPESIPSRFKVNLPEIQAEEMAEAEKEKETYKYFRNIVNETMGSAGIDRSNYIKKKPKKRKKPDKNISAWTDKQINKTRQLAFYWLFKLLKTFLTAVYKFFKKLVYSLGWLFLFTLRFTYLAFTRALKSIKPKSKALARKNRISLLKFLNNSRARVLAYNTSRQTAKEVKKEELIREKQVRVHEEQLLLSAEEPDDYERGYLKPAIVFLLILMSITLPFKVINYVSGFDFTFKRGQVLGAAESAIGDMAQAVSLISEAEYNSAKVSFTNASNNFISAKEDLSDINNFFFTLAGMVPSQEIKLMGEAKKILKAGELGAGIGVNLTAAIQKLENWDGESSLNTQLEDAIIEARQALVKITDLNKILADIDQSAIPSDYRGQFISTRERLKDFSTVFNKFIGLLEQANVFLGAQENKRYLLVFQNNSELRASGGFIGSYALVDILDGKVRSVEAPGGGSYDMEAGMKIRVKAPKPLWLVNPLWHFWDANWWPDWPTSAEKLAWFYEKSDGPTVDGVIGITPVLIERFLELTGPVDMSEEYGEIIDSGNFWETVQSYSEQKPDVTNKPKKIISDLINKLLDEQPERIKEAGLFEIIKMIETCLGEKQILLYFTDENLEKTVKDFGWSGETLDTRWDYLEVINTNIAGGKSNRVIEEELNLISEVLTDGTIINTLKIKQTHTGAYNQEFIGVGNNNWMRVYVPYGSKLLNAQGFSNIRENFFETPDESWTTDEFIAEHEDKAIIDPGSGTKIYGEFDKTVYANWVQLKPGETKTVILKYELPFKIALNESLNEDTQNDRLIPYALLVQKQAGAKPSIFRSKLVLSNNSQPIWSYPEDLSISKTGWLINDRLDRDKYWAVILKYLGSD